MSINTDDIINSYFKGNTLVKHQIESYNKLIDDIIPNILSQYFPISIDYNDSIIKNITLNIVKLNVGQPFYTENNGCSKLLTPDMARVKNTLLFIAFDY